MIKNLLGFQNTSTECIDSIKIELNASLSLLIIYHLKLDFWSDWLIPYTLW